MPPRAISRPFSMSEQDTIVALSTPSGESALAMIRLSGPLSLTMADQALGCQNPVPRQATLARYHAINAELLDQAVFIYYPKGNSYTGAEMLEIHCHGNPLIVQKILEDLIARGCRMALPGEFTRIAFFNHKMDLSQAEAVADLIQARSDKALKAAHQQLSGVLGNKIKSLIDNILSVISTIEAYIDFPEEDLPLEDPKGPLSQIRFLIVQLEELEKTAPYSALLHEGIKTVIIGAPNAGKSSLLNALTGENRAIVSPQPGTTRDFIAERIIVGPYSLRIMDTAGLQNTESDLDRLGIEKTMEKIREADFYLVVIDSAIPPPHLPPEVLERLSPDKTVVIENKIDLPQSSKCPDFLSQCPHSRLSLLSGEGLALLRETLTQTLTDNLKGTSGPEELIVNARHATALKKACSDLRAAQSKLETSEFAELVVSDLRNALDAMGTITGKVDNEAVLDKLFSTFCIGK